MDILKYTEAVSLKKKTDDWNLKRACMLGNFDAMITSTSDITDVEFINRMTSMRADIVRYFDAQIAVLDKQFRAL